MTQAERFAKLLGLSHQVSPTYMRQAFYTGIGEHGLSLDALHHAYDSGAIEDYTVPNAVITCEALLFLLDSTSESLEAIDPQLVRTVANEALHIAMMFVDHLVQNDRKFLIGEGYVFDPFSHGSKSNAALDSSTTPWVDECAEAPVSLFKRNFKLIQRGENDA